MIDAARLEKELVAVADGSIILMETSAEDATELGIAALKAVADEGFKIIVVSSSRPCTNLLGLYSKGGVDTGKVFLIDTVCKSMMTAPPEADNVLHLENAPALTDISLALTETLDALKGKKIIFVDSITSMLIHNKPDVFARFIHSVLTKARLGGIGCLLVSLSDQTDREVRAEIAQLCDKVIKL